MAKFIKLTQDLSDPIDVNLDHVAFIRAEEDDDISEKAQCRAVLHLINGKELPVNQTVENVRSLIEEGE